MRWKLIDKEAVKDKVEKFIAKQANSKEPYVIWGVVNTLWKKDGGDLRATQDPDIVIQRSRVGISVQDIQAYKNKGFVLLDYFFPTQADLPLERTEGMASESGWRLELRKNAGFFNGVKRECDITKSGDDSGLIRALSEKDKVIIEKEKQIAEMKKLYEKGKEIAADIQDGKRKI